jgi:hypothetical protein
MTEGSEMIERFFNQLTDKYETLSSQHVDDAGRALLRTGAGGDYARRTGAISDRRFTGAAGALGLRSGGGIRGAEGPNMLDRLGLTLDRGGAGNVPEFTGTFRTGGERREAYADALRGSAGGSRRNFWGGVMTGAGVGAAAGGAIGLAGLGIGAIPGAVVGGLVGAGAAAFGGMFGADSGSQQLGAFFESESTQGLVMGIHSADARVREHTMGAVSKQMSDLVSRQKHGEELGKDDSAKLEGLKAIGAFNDYMELERANPKGIPADKLRALEKQYGMSAADIQAKGQGMRGVTAHSQTERTASFFRKTSSQAKEQASGLARGGVYNAETGQLTAKFAGAVGGAGQDVVGALVASIHTQSLITGEEHNVQADDSLFRSAAGMEESARKRLSQMSVSEQRKLASTVAEAGGGEVSQYIYGQAAAQQRVESVIKRRGKDRAGGELLGLDREELERLKGEKDPHKRLGSLAAALGVKAGDPTNKEFMGMLEQYQTAISRGDSGAATLSLQKIQGTEIFKKFEGEKRDRDRQEKMSQREADDPLLAAVKDSSNKQVEVLKLIAQKQGVTNEQLSKLDTKDPEAKTG